MRIAIVGTGISGMTCGWLLSRVHEITMFEAGDYIGGHTNTVTVRGSRGEYNVDTGFIVFNSWTYPNFISLLDKLGVLSQPSEMSFSVRADDTDLEYSGNSINTLYAQRKNIFRMSHHAMLNDVMKFNRLGKRFIVQGDETTSIGAFLEEGRFGQAFIQYYLVPMMAAIWSTDPGRVYDFPARHFLQFFENHGLMNIMDRPQWHVIQGGSKGYIPALTGPYADRIRLNSPVESIRRHADRVEVRSNGNWETFDQVVLACHSDQALRMIEQPTEAEDRTLGAIAYQANEAILHTDPSILPRRKKAWASWNYYIPESGIASDTNRVTLTYNMNILQSLEAEETFCVTLNDQGYISPDRVIKRIQYHHPLYTYEAIRAQKDWGVISGLNRTHYCGAYWGYGFHEDGVKSGIAVARSFGIENDL